MNAGSTHLARKEKEQSRLQAIIEDFRKAEEPMIAAGQTEFAALLRDALPRLQADAIESGHFTGEVTLKVSVNLGVGQKCITIEGVSTPRPWSLKRTAPVKY